MSSEGVFDCGLLRYMGLDQNQASKDPLKDCVRVSDGDSPLRIKVEGSGRSGILVEVIEISWNTISSIQSE